LNDVHGQAPCLWLNQIEPSNDRFFLDCLQRNDFDRLAQVDERTYQSGTSEVKLYVPVLVAMEQLGMGMNLVDYVPCYRTEAGTGEGMGFFYWCNGKGR
jgi:hypothetical protein